MTLKDFTLFAKASNLTDKQLFYGLERFVDSIIADSPSSAIQEKAERSQLPSGAENSSVRRQDLAMLPPDRVKYTAEPNKEELEESKRQSEVVPKVEISSQFGPRFHPVHKKRKHHNGTDLAVPIGTPVYAISSGIIESAAFDTGAGRYVNLITDDGRKVKYFHLSSFSVRKGDEVSAMQQIGKSGNTGVVTAAHLHLEVHEKDAKGNYRPRAPTNEELSMSLGGVEIVEREEKSRRNSSFSISFPLTKKAVNVSIQPYDEMVNKAVKLIEDVEPGYFSSISKIEVESTISNHFGKVESDKTDTIFISLNKIKSAIAGSSDESEILIRIVEVLAHEMGHLKSNLDGGEAPADQESKRIVDKVIAKGI